MLEASTGYFINPLVNILLGMIFLGERFRRMQCCLLILWCAACWCNSGRWLAADYRALGLAFGFAFYGTVRQEIAVEAQTGMLVEACMAVAGRRDLSVWHRR